MTVLQQFLWGFVGSLAVEIVKIHLLLGASRRLPLRYLKPVFWIARVLLALTAGGLAVAYDIETPVLALHVGAATPLIVQALAQNLGKLLASYGEGGEGVEEKPVRRRKPTPRARKLDGTPERRTPPLP